MAAAGGNRSASGAKTQQRKASEAAKQKRYQNAKKGSYSPKAGQQQPGGGKGGPKGTQGRKPAKAASSAKEFIKKIAKIERLPKDVRSSIPLEGFMPNGIIEVSPGKFTKAYRLEDVNFTIATLETQNAIYTYFQNLLNMFEPDIKWQFCIFNHEIDKKQTIENLRILPQRDGLNKYRQEMNAILLKNLKSGNNSIKQEKYLVVAVEEQSADKAVARFRKLDSEISNRIRPITTNDTKPMTTQERMKLLYTIYNQDLDYRFATGIYDNKEEFNLRHLEKLGISVKDVIGPASMDFSRDNVFMLNDTYAQALYLERVPTFLSTNFLTDISDIQSNMLISITSEKIDQARAVKMVRNQLTIIEGRASALDKRNAENGYFGALPPDLEKSQTSARELLSDLMNRNQNLFFLTITVVMFAKTREQLDENLALLRQVAGKHLCPLKPMKFQQEFCFNTALPLCRNDIFAERLYTTESAGIFIPYNTQEINQKNAIFYGLNQVSKSMVLYGRTAGANYIGLIFGFSGSGKSFTAKGEMASVLLNKPDAQVFVIDPQGEYSPFVKIMKGQEILLAPGSGAYINPLDLDMSPDADSESDPVTMKSDFMINMFDIISGELMLDAPSKSIIDKCVRKIYRAYIDELQRTGKTCDLQKCPTLGDLYKELTMMRRERYEAGHLADILYQYAVGSFDTFAHRTNVETNARFVSYNTKMLGSGMRELGLFICLNDIWNRMIQNAKRHMYTWFYIDEFHILLESDGSTMFLRRIWKMARKWRGVPTGIMQNTEDILRSAETRSIFNNTAFIIMLKSQLMDRQNYADLLNLSNSQLDYVTDSRPGHGLLYNGKVTLPFGYTFPKNTKLYDAMTTKHDGKPLE